MGWCYARLVQNLYPPDQHGREFLGQWIHSLAAAAEEPFLTTGWAKPQESLKPRDLPCIYMCAAPIYFLAGWRRGRTFFGPEQQGCAGSSGKIA